jgi:hypothetical protein
MSTIDVVELVKAGKARFEWYDIESEHDGMKLTTSVFRDAMKFDDIPALTWDFKPVPGDDRKFDGVRLPASATQLQEIADLLGCSLLTPKIIDLIWIKAGIKFDSIVNVKGQIVAVSNINDVHEAIEKKIAELGGDDGSQLVSCVGKYWCLVNGLLPERMVHGDYVCCNYGWCAKSASGPGVTPGVQCWQRPGFAHNKLHWDPSQTIRLMFQWAWLTREGERRPAQIHIHDVLDDPELAPLLSHEGVLKVFRQPGVSAPEGKVLEDGTIEMPELLIYDAPNAHPMVPVRGGHPLRVETDDENIA